MHATWNQWHGEGGAGEEGGGARAAPGAKFRGAPELRQCKKFVEIKS